MESSISYNCPKKPFIMEPGSSQIHLPFLPQSPQLHLLTRFLWLPLRPLAQTRLLRSPSVHLFVFSLRFGSPFFGLANLHLRRLPHSLLVGESPLTHSAQRSLNGSNSTEISNSPTHTQVSTMNLFKGCNRLDTISDMCRRLKDNDPVFWSVIENTIDTNGHGSSLLQLLRMVEGDKVDLPVPFATELVLHCTEVEVNNRNLKSYLFVMNGIQFNITLQDILYLTRLPIAGKAVIPPSGKSRDLQAMDRVFQLGEVKKVSLTKLVELACNGDQNETRRIQAILLLIINCIVTPSTAGHVCRTTHVQFIEDLSLVDKYAWGAAMLAFLYHGLKKWHFNKTSSIPGNIWIILGFFLYHIPKLQQTLNISLEEPTLTKPPLACVVDALRPIGANRRMNITQVRETLNTLQENDVTWQPYNLEMLPTHLRSYVRCCKITTPIFFFNFVEYHLPSLVANQFEGLELIDLRDFKPIKFKENSGSSEQRFLEHYKVQHEMWIKEVEIPWHRWRPPPPKLDMHENSSLN